MRFANALDINIATLLRSIGFKRKGNVYLRIYGDGILQCIFLSRESSARNSNLSIAIRSIYEPEVFGDVSVYRGALTYPYELSDFNIDKVIYPSDYDLLEYACISKLNETNTQESYIKLVSLLDSERFGFVRWYMEMISIPSLMALGRYELALQKCDIVLSNNNELTPVLQMKNTLATGNEELIKSFLKEAKSNNLQQYARLKFR